MRLAAHARWLAPLVALPFAVGGPRVARADDTPPAGDEEPPHMRILVHPAPPDPSPTGSRVLRPDETPQTRAGAPAAAEPAPWKPDPRCADDRCAELGLCSYVAGECVAGSTDDCEQSSACSGDGECFFDREDQECSDGTAFESPGTLAAGIVFTALGGVLVTTGVYLARTADLCLDDSCSPDERETSSTMVDLGNGLAFGGVLSIIAGVAAVIAGSNQVLKTERFASLPTLSAGPGGGALVWTF